MALRSTAQVFQVFAEYSIDPNAQGMIDCGGIPDFYVWFRDSANLGAQRSKCVLLNPTLPGDKIVELLPVITRHVAPVTFRLIDALNYREVFSVGYSNAELNQQAQNDIGVSRKKAFKQAESQHIIVPKTHAAEQLDQLL